MLEEIYSKLVVVGLVKVHWGNLELTNEIALLRSSSVLKTLSKMLEVILTSLVAVVIRDGSIGD